MTFPDAGVEDTVAYEAQVVDGQEYEEEDGAVEEHVEEGTAEEHPEDGVTHEDADAEMEG